MTRWSGSILSLVAPLFLLFAGASPAVADPIEDAIAQSAVLIRSECEAGRFSGVAAILIDGRERYFHACGRTRYPNGPAITRDTRFKLFSTSKQFTAATIMRLVGRDVLSLDDTIGQWAPEAPALWRPVTIRQLLMHRGGIPNDLDGYGPLYKDAATPAMLAWFAARADAPTGFEPGSQFAYSNMGYEVLALIAERAAKRPWAQVIQREIFTPMGMRGALLERPILKDGRADGPCLEQGMARGYTGAPGALEEASSFAFVMRGSGALHAALADIEAYERGLLRGRVLSPAQQRAMYENPIDRTGYGWFVRLGPSGRLIINHSGGTNGYAVEYARIPEARVAVILLTNLGFSDVETYRRQISLWIDAAIPRTRRSLEHQVSRLEACCATGME
jgi:D-alanyl-D-alanine carboxypeptidase